MVMFQAEFDGANRLAARAYTDALLQHVLANVDEPGQVSLLLPLETRQWRFR